MEQPVTGSYLHRPVDCRSFLDPARFSDIDDCPGSLIGVRKTSRNQSQRRSAGGSKTMNRQAKPVVAYVPSIKWWVAGSVVAMCTLVYFSTKRTLANCITNKTPFYLLWLPSKCLVRCLYRSHGTATAI